MLRVQQREQLRVPGHALGQDARHRARRGLQPGAAQRRQQGLLLQEDYADQ